MMWKPESVCTTPEHTPTSRAKAASSKACTQKATTFTREIINSKTSAAEHGTFLTYRHHLPRPKEAQAAAILGTTAVTVLASHLGERHTRVNCCLVLGQQSQSGILAADADLGTGRVPGKPWQKMAVG